MTAVTEDEIVEAMVGAMCEADGRRWFDSASWRNLFPFGKIILWEDYYRSIARRQYRAYLAMQAAIVED